MLQNLERRDTRQQKGVCRGELAVGYAKAADQQLTEGVERENTPQAQSVYVIGI